MKFLIFALSMLFFFQVQAALEIPRQLSSVERRKALEILGYSSAFKVLGNPYPLGGFSGIEIGYSTEVISTGELASLGSKPKSQSETSFSTLTMGKGLYNNLDVFLQFSPFSQEESISSFGGQVRWGFYQAEYLPAHLSAIIYANTTNFDDKIIADSQGADLVAGFSVKDLTLYTGVGMNRTIGTFLGGTQESVTADGQDAKEDMSTTHYLAGINIKFSRVFLAMQLDRYTQSTYSAKLGLRF